MDAGNSANAACSTCATASPSATPGLRLKDTVTDGSWPVWFTDSGPTPVSTRVRLDSGMRSPFGVFRCNRLSAEASS